jgi:hypothetical protein
VPFFMVVFAAGNFVGPLSLGGCSTRSAASP